MEIKYFISLHPLVISHDIPALDTFWRHEVRSTIHTKLTTQPELFGKPLRQTLKGHRSLRIGDYRVVYRIEKRVIRVLAVIHRSTDYKGVDKRI